MEKVEVSRIPIDGVGKYPDKDLISYEYQFAFEEVKILKTILKQFEPSDVKKFISLLEFYCRDMLHIKDGPERTAHKDKLQYMLKTFKATLTSIKSLEKGYIGLSRLNSITDLHRERESISKDSHYSSDRMAAMFSGAKLSRKISTPLNSLIEIIENQLKDEKRGRGRPESYSKGFAGAILKIYIEYFKEKPTTYYDGTFTKIISFALGAAGLPATDPSSLIKQILK